MKITILLVLFCASGSLGIKCRVCGTLGICSGPGDNGITKDCIGESNACYFAKSSKFSHFKRKLRLIWKSLSEFEGIEQVQRRCGFSPDGENGCQSQVVDGVEIQYCYCTSDDCNLNACSCPSRLKCRQCGELDTGFKCEGPDDQGELKECPDRNLICFHHDYDNGDTYRGCTIETGPEACFEGDDSRKCQCKSDNCNRDKECYPQSRCGSADKWYNF